MNTAQILQYLIDLERRVRNIYRLLSERPQCSAALRLVWQAMADDETRHLVTLERSAHLFDVMDSPPSIPGDALARVEAMVAAAEAAVQNPQLTEDEAFHQALNVEGSELNRLDETWLRGFRITTSLLLRALAPEMPSHIRRLVDAVHSFSADPALYEQADALWATYQGKQGN